MVGILAAPQRRQHARSCPIDQAVRPQYRARPFGSVDCARRSVLLLGANGAGKTTTIDLFLNFVQPTSGTARINGLDVTEKPLETKRYVAYIPEQVMLYKTLNRLENLEYFSALAGHDKYTRDDLMRLFDEVGLAGEAAERRVASYSKGMRQKVGMAIALAKQAKALLLDEPTSGLDRRPPTSSDASCSS